MQRQLSNINNNAFEEFEIADSDSAPLIDLPEKPQPSYCESFYSFLGKLKNNIYTAADIQPELNYTVGVVATYFSKTFMDYIPSSWPRPILPEIPSTAITVGWNYLDAVCGLVSAVKLISDKESYHQRIDKTKAVLNIISSVQSLLFTYQNFFPALGVTGLAGPAFTYAVLTDCITQSIDVSLAGKRANILGWLEESLNELKQIEERLETTSTDDKEYDNLVVIKTQLISDIRSRCRASYFQNEKIDFDDDYTEDGSTLIVNMKNIQTPMQFRRKQLNEVFFKSGVKNELIDFDLCFSTPDEADYARSKAIQLECDENLRALSVSLVYKIVSLTGMSLMSASVLYSSLFIPGLILSSSVSAYYLGRNLSKLKECLYPRQDTNLIISSNPSSFFNQDAGGDLDDEYVDADLLVAQATAAR